MAEVPPQTGYAVGAVAWAKAGPEPAGTAGSQFFIVTGSGGASLPADYGTIGTVTAGHRERAEDRRRSRRPVTTAHRPIPMYLVSVEITEA